MPAKVKFLVPKSEAAKPDSAPSPTPEPPANVEGVPSLPPENSAADPKPKRGPGRPKKNAPVPLDIPTVESDDEEQSVPKPDKPKRGPGRPKSKGSIVRDPAKLAESILGYHALADAIMPGVMISPSQAQAMADRIVDVMDAWDFQPNPKVTSLLALIGTVAVIELPNLKKVRFNLVQKAQAARSAKAQAAQSQNNIATGTPVTNAMPAQVAAESNLGEARLKPPGPVAIGS